LCRLSGRLDAEPRWGRSGDNVSRQRGRISATQQVIDTAAAAVADDDDDDADDGHMTSCDLPALTWQTDQVSLVRHAADQLGESRCAQRGMQ